MFLLVLFHHLKIRTETRFLNKLYKVLYRIRICNHFYDLHLNLYYEKFLTYKLMK